MSSELDERGFTTLRNVVPPDTVEALIRFFDIHSPGRHGVRDILSLEPVKTLLDSPQIRSIKEIAGAKPVRGIFFDKLPGANWKVTWHQDVTIAVRERHEVEGYGPWSSKAGLLHVQPPADVLERMVALRLHLDDCGADNGALKVICSTHLLGKLSQDRIDELAKREAHVCEAQAGDFLLMKPLLLHSSSPSLAPRHRRVVHIEFAHCDLPTPLQWAA